MVIFRPRLFSDVFSKNRELTPEQKQAKYEYNKKYRAENTEKVASYQEAYRNINAEKLTEQHAKWYAEHAEEERPKHRKWWNENMAVDEKDTSFYSSPEYKAHMSAAKSDEKNPRWKGGKSLVYQRKIYTSLVKDRPQECELCHSTDDLAVHHIDGNHSNNDPRNLMIVCEVCHGVLHRNDVIWH